MDKRNSRPNTKNIWLNRNQKEKQQLPLQSNQQIQPQQKIPIKIAGEYTSKITPNGLTPTKTKERTIHEYANTSLLTTLLNDIIPQLQKYFPNN